MKMVQRKAYTAFGETEFGEMGFGKMGFGENGKTPLIMCGFNSKTTVVQLSTDVPIIVVPCFLGVVN